MGRLSSFRYAARRVASKSSGKPKVRARLPPCSRSSARAIAGTSLPCLPLPPARLGNGTGSLVTLSTRFEQGGLRVERVELKLEAGEVHVYLGHGEQGKWPCPKYGALCRLYDHQAERRWRHLDTCQYQTILHAEPPRSECGRHGVRVVKLPWAEPTSQFTALFEALAIAWLKASSQSAVAKLLRLTWDEIHGIMERAVQRSLKRSVVRARRAQAE